MRLREAMARGDGLRMNTAPEEQKARWVWELDSQLGEMMGLAPRPFRWPEEDPVLRMPPPHEDIYPLYLVCKLDYYNMEMELYANDREIYDAALREARAWWRRNHRPGRGKNWRV